MKVLKIRLKVCEKSIKMAARMIFYYGLSEILTILSKERYLSGCSINHTMIPRIIIKAAAKVFNEYYIIYYLIYIFYKGFLIYQLNWCLIVGFLSSLNGPMWCVRFSPHEAHKSVSAYFNEGLSFN